LDSPLILTEEHILGVSEEIEYLDLSRRKWWEAGENCIMKSSILCMAHQISLE
jgi:hypothetical protein